MEKKIKETEALKVTIARKFIMLLTLMNWPNRNVAKYLNVSEEELIELPTLKDEELSHEWLFRIFYIAQISSVNQYKEDYVIFEANELKNTCLEEIERRYRNKF